MDTTINIEEIKEKLCYYDIRNPNNNDFCKFTEEEINNLKEDCYCDNCFYGRTKLANIILELLNK